MSTKLGDSFVNEQAVNFLTRDAWQNWTPTVNQGGGVAATVTFARYVVIANTVILRARLAITAAGVAGNAILIGGLPFNIANGGDNLYAVGSGVILDVSAAYYSVTVSAETVSSLSFTGYGAASRMGVAPNFALANGDVIGFCVTYERSG